MGLQVNDGYEIGGLYWTVLFWQWIAIVIGFRKMYGLCGLNHHIKKKMFDVTPVTKRRTEESRK